MITATEINVEELYRRFDEERGKGFGSLYDELKPFRIFKIRDFNSEPVPVFGSESWINSTKVFPEKYQIDRSLYESEFIKVNLCRNLLNDELVAIKFIRLLNATEAGDSKIKLRHDRIEREISIIQDLRHNFIIGFKEFFRLVDCVAIVMEYAQNGELFEHVRERQTLPEPDAKTIMFQIFLAVDHIHSKGIVHRDLKLENILLDEGNCVKMADFGFANYWNDSRRDGSGLDWEILLKTSCGSPCYAAPEIVLSNKGYNGFAVDIWSCGVIMFALLFGHLPFEEQALRHLRNNNIYAFNRQYHSTLNVYQLYQYISRNQLEIPRHVRVSSEAVDLVKGMLRSDPGKRITLTDIFRHSWFANSQLL